MIGGTRFSTRNFFFAMAIPLHPADNSSSPVVPFFDALAAENGVCWRLLTLPFDCRTASVREAPALNHFSLPFQVLSTGMREV